MRIAIALGVVVALAACGPSSSSSSQQARGHHPAEQSPPPTLAAAIRHASDLGPAGDTTIVSLSFSLKVRDPDRLAALIASGRTVTPAAYSAEFSPDPVAVQSAVD
ncbi:MAG: hypothetical protein M3R21_00545, partial [Candidatus Dormibacteraeota bacterium]|nr:hypothetical protein [Candidatus Dormibacteraeota bacterium]